MTDTSITFAKLPRGQLEDLVGARAVVIGAAEASPYEAGVPSHSANAPSALRAVSQGFAAQLVQYDFDLGRPMLGPDGETFGLMDCGDVPTDPADAGGNRARIQQAVGQILRAGAVPVVLGGDDSVPIPVCAAFEGHGPVTVLQIDAHVDWGDVIKGNSLGYGSPMRRAAEMPWITGMLQIGMRGLGSGGAWQIEDARRWGSKLVTSREFHRNGAADVLSHLPEGGDVVVSIDCDGIDPSVLAAVNMPTPGGLTYEDMMAILEGVATRGRLAGVILAELVPERDDPCKLSTLTASRMVAVALGHIAHRSTGKI